VRFSTVSRRGIGHGEVRFLPLETGSLIDYRSSTRYDIDWRDPLYGERITGTVAGEQHLKSRLRLVPREPLGDDDVAAFNVVATTDFVLSATGTVASRGYDDGRYTGDATFRIAGSGTTHNPADPAAVRYHSYAPERYPAVSDTAGTLRLYRANGRHVYEMEIGFAQIVPQYEVLATRTHQCRDTDVAPRSTARTTYSNATLRHEDEHSDPGECWSAPANPYSVEEPYAFGALGLLRTTSHPVSGSSAMFTGVYDPATGVIEGEETVTIRQCPVVRGHDPLQLESVLQSANVWKDDLDVDGQRCTLQYTVRWQFFLPGR
jgi:hypothetical protein